MKMMKALVYDRPGVGSIREVPMPVCGPDDVVIKVVSAAICKGADRRHQTTGHSLGRYPITTGHEFAGYVYEIGENVTEVKVGDRVTADNALPCGKCYYCKINRPELCDDFGSIGHNVPGGFAQFLKAPRNKIYKLPDNLSFNEGCLTEPVACAIHAMDRLGAKFGENMLIFGTGPNGIMLAQMMKHSDAEHVVALGSTQFKLDLLEKLGIDTVLIDRNNPDAYAKVLNERFPRGVDAIVDATGSINMLMQEIPFLGKGGRLLQYSAPPNTDSISISPELFYRKELQYYTSHYQTHNFARALACMESGKVQVKDLVTGEYTLDQFFTAIEDVTSHDALKLIIHPNEGLK